MILQIEAGGAYNAALLCECDLVSATAKSLAGTVLNFHERHGVSIAYDQVDLSAATTIISLNDLNVLSAQPALRFSLPVSALGSTQSD